MSRDEDVDVAIEVANNGAWLDECRAELKTESGAELTGVSVDAEGITVSGEEKFGSGQTPYAADPSHHVEMLNHPTQTSGEGTVVYESGSTADEYPLELPKQLFFDERHEFDSPVESVEQLEEEIEAAIGVRPDLREAVEAITA